MSDLPLEFVVRGVPRSPQAKTVNSWKDRVRSAAKEIWPQDRKPLSEELSVTVVYFHIDRATIDVDNMVKPILDALDGVVYWDDREVSQVLSRRTRLDKYLVIEGASERLTRELQVAQDFVYVVIRGKPNHGQLP